MKSVKLLKLAVPALMLVSGTAFGGIASTKHDLSALNGTADNGEICVYCHTPHNASTDLATVLWNKGASAVTDYDTYTSSTMNSVPGQPGAKSDACLACHDGTLAYDSIVNAPGLGNTIAGSTTMTGAALVGSDLSNDHPIAIDITTAGAGIDTSAGDLSPYLEGNLIECSTCHDVHSDAQVSFLRVTNVGSAMCLDCHQK